MATTNGHWTFIMSFSIFFFHLMDMKIVKFWQHNVVTNSQNGVGGGVGIFFSSMAIIKELGALTLMHIKMSKPTTYASCYFSLCFYFFDFALQTFNFFIFENNLDLFFIFFFDLKGSKLRCSFKLPIVFNATIENFHFKLFIFGQGINIANAILFCFPLLESFFLKPYNSSLDEYPLKKCKRSHDKSWIF